LSESANELIVVMFAVDIIVIATFIMKFYSSVHSKIFVDVCVVAKHWVHISDKAFLVYE
jgi:hypothetical protein